MLLRSKVGWKTTVLVLVTVVALLAQTTTGGFTAQTGSTYDLTAGTVKITGTNGNLAGFTSANVLGDSGVAAGSVAGNNKVNTPWICKPTSASGTAYDCSSSLTLIDGTAITNSAPISGQVLLFFPDVANTGAITIRTDGANNKTARFTTTASQNNSFVAGDLASAVGNTVPYVFSFNAAAQRWLLQGGLTPTLSAGTGISVNTTDTFTPIISTTGTPFLSASGRATAQTAAAASLATFTVGGADASFWISANVLVTASATHSFTMTCTYTDEGNTARTLTLSFSQVTGTFLTAITNVQGTGAYEGVPVQIRAKSTTAITLQTTGTFTSVTYNVEGFITKVQ